MNYPKFYIGPMSKNIVDSIIEFTNANNIPLGVIPSRRQIEFDGGYVNNWKTEEFIDYIRYRQNKTEENNIILERDHAGPGQGLNYDDGYESLKYDCAYPSCFNIIHIDPWKDNQNYKDGLAETIKMIDFCNRINHNLLYEIGTEEAIRKFEVEELETFIIDLQYGLGQELFDKIKYLVIQSGTSLKSINQTGKYDKDRLSKMVKLSKKYKLLSKEHNGDYLSLDLIKEKFVLGLDSINIAPEFGLIETQTYLELFEDSKHRFSLFDDFYEICYKSKRWEKWVDKNFIPEDNKEELIEVCGHYVLSSPEFIEKIKNKLLKEFDNLDQIIKNNIKEKLETYDL